MIKDADYPRSPLRKKGWQLTFCDDFDIPVLDDMYWYPAYRSGRKEYFRRIGHPSRWQNHNACYEISDSLLKLKVTPELPWRKRPSDNCVSCVCTSDHRFGRTTREVQVLEKFAQEFGRFEARCRCPSAKGGLMSAFWLHHTDPLHQEYTPEGERRDSTGEKLEIDVFENLGSEIEPGKSTARLSLHYTSDGHYAPDFPVDFSAHFHEFAIEWMPDVLSWFIDGEEVARYDGETPRGRMFILLALFHYSGWIGEVDPEMRYPKVFEVDYVRAYRKVARPQRQGNRP